MNNVVRFGVSIDEKLLMKFDHLINDKGYVNRSEAVRDLIREKLDSDRTQDPESQAIGTLTLIYSHDIHELSDKLNDIQHKYHHNIVSTTHIHLDAHNCLEVLILRGRAREVQSIADNLISIKNVRLGKLTVTSRDI